MLSIIRQVLPNHGERIYGQDKLEKLQKSRKAPDWYVDRVTMPYSDTIRNRCWILFDPNEYYGGNGFEDLEVEEKTHYANLALVQQISENIGRLNGDFFLPERLNINIHNWMRLGISTPHDKEGKDRCVEDEVRWEIEHAWRTRVPKQYKNYRKDNDEFALMWFPTALASCEAVYSEVKRLDEAFNPDTFKRICETLHILMVNYNLWGKDSKNIDRAYENGQPKFFENISPDLQELYVLITLATIDGIIVYKARQKQNGEKQAA